MNEKIKFRNGAEYEVAPGGIYFGEDTAKLILILPAGKSYDDVELDVTGNDSIKVIDASGEVVETRTGYAYLDTLTKKKDYNIGTVQETETETGSAEVATVMIATLKKADLRAELEAAKAEIANLNETVDLLVITTLEV